jgi:cation diffusion facilitator family transporter
MMIAEIVGGLLFGSIALVADGMHMSTHAGALLLAALAYTYARKHANDPNFAFGTGKLGNLAGFTSAIILAMIALLIGYESVSGIFAPVAIHFREAIPIACLGLAVNVASAWLLSRGGHHHGHSRGHAHEGHDHDEAHHIATGAGIVALEIFEDGVPPHFRLRSDASQTLGAHAIKIETVPPDGAWQRLTMADRDGYMESNEEIPEPHAFTVHLKMGDATYAVEFVEHEQTHSATARDNNMRAAIIHVIADAAVSVCVIVGLLLARAFGWLWMDPFVGIVGATVIASWSYGLIRDTGCDPPQHEPRPEHGDQFAPSRRERGRPARRSAPLAFGAGACGGDYFGCYDRSAGDRLLSRPARPLPVAVTSHRRGFT